MDFQGSTLLDPKNFSKTWSCLLTFMTLLWIVCQRNLIVNGSVIESGKNNVPIGQGAFGRVSVSDSSDGSHSEKQVKYEQNRRPHQHNGRDQWITSSQRIQGKPTFPVRESGNGEDELAKTWLEGRLPGSEDDGVHGRGDDEESVSSVGKRPWFQSWGGKRRRALGPNVNINKVSGKRGFRKLTFKELPNNEDTVVKFNTEQIKRPAKILNIVQQRKPITTQQVDRESWSSGQDLVQKQPQKDWKILRETSDEMWNDLARSPQQIIKNLNYFSPIPYFYGAPSRQTKHDENISDQEKFFYNLDNSLPFNFNEKKSIQREISDSDWGSSHQRWLSDKVTQPDTNIPDSNMPDTDNLAHLGSFDDLKFKNSTMREWIARENGRDVLLRAFKSLYHQMSNVPGAQMKSNEKKTFKNVNRQNTESFFQSKVPKSSAYWTHKKRPAFHSWGGKKRNKANTYLSSNAPGWDQKVHVENTNLMLNELPLRNERSILSYKTKRTLNSAGDIGAGQTNHGTKFDSLGPDPIRNGFSNEKSDSLPALPMVHQDIMENKNSESITGSGNEVDLKVGKGDVKLSGMSTANNMIRHKRHSYSIKLVQTDDTPGVMTDPSQEKTNFDHERTARSSSENHEFSRSVLSTHELDKKRSLLDVSLSKRRRRESKRSFEDATRPEISPAHFSDISFLNELKQNDRGYAAAAPLVDVTNMAADETSTLTEPPFPKFITYPYTDLGETVAGNGRPLTERPSPYSWWEKSKIIGDIEKRPSFHSWSGKRDSVGELEKRLSFSSWSEKSDVISQVEKRPSFHSWSGKRDDVGELEKRPSFHSWSGKRDSVGELEKRPSFSSWSGKRDVISQLEKRPSFHSWSGKRDSFGELEKRPSFHSWSGKRDSVGGIVKRPSFSSWSGKRNNFGEIEKRPSFHSWSGKRGTSEDHDSDFSSESVKWNPLSNIWKLLPRMEEVSTLSPLDTSFYDRLEKDNIDYFLKPSSLNVFPEPWNSSQDEQET